jgi:hypothetical protein
LHYRRCLLGEATHVAICVQNTKADDTEVTFDLNYIQGIRRFFSSFYATVHDVMTFIFSDHNTFGCPRTSNGVFNVCPVEKDDNGTRFITFRFRRYNIDGDQFLPGVWDSGSYIKDIVEADTSEGLSEDEVEARRHVVGRNTIKMERPAFLRTLKREISKPFYTYQTFMIWTVSRLLNYGIDFSQFDDVAGTNPYISQPFPVVPSMVLLHGSCLDDCCYFWCFGCELLPIPQ